MLNVGAIIAGAFALVRNRPGAFLVWTLIYVAALFAMTMVLRPVYQTQMAAAGDPRAALANMGSQLGLSLLIQLGFYLVIMLLFTAALRAALRPEEDGLAFIRLGGDELRVTGLAIFMLVCFYLAFVILGVILAVVAAALGAAGGIGAAIGVGVVEVIALICLFAWVYVRLSLALPLTFINKTFVLAQSWRLTRGRFWTLFGGYFVIGLIVFMLSIAAGAVTAGSYLTELVQHGFSPQAMRTAMQHQLERQASMDAMFLFGMALNAIVGALSIALGAGAVAAAARALAAGQDGIAETFA